MKTTLTLRDGRQMNVDTFSEGNDASEMAAWNRDFPKVLAPMSAEGRKLLAEVFERHRETLLTLAQAAKNDIDGSGAFQGINCKTGFGMSPIRPDYLVLNTNPKLWTTTLAGLTAGNWYGLFHNGLTGAAYVADSFLYQRKETAQAIIGFLDLSPKTLVEELQFNLEGTPQAILRPKETLAGGDFPFFELPDPMYIAPRKQYNSQFRVNAVAGEFTLVPVGISFATSAYMKTTAPAGPTTTPP